MRIASFGSSSNARGILAGQTIPVNRQYLETPFYGPRRIGSPTWGSALGHEVNVKRVRWLIDLEAVYQKPRLSVRNPEHKGCPYLLRDVTAERSEQVWCTDIT